MAGLRAAPTAPTSHDQAGLFEQRDEVVGLDDPARGAAPADQRLHAGGGHVLQVERGLVDEEELVVLEGDRAGPSRAPCGSGPRPASRTRTRRSGSCPSHLARYIAISASRSSSSAETRSPAAMPTLAVTVRRFVGALELERLLERFQQTLGDQLGADVAATSSSATITNSSPPSRPERVDIAHDARPAARRPRAAVRRRRHGRACR